MPTYEYKCDACGHAFEKFQSIMSGPIRKCPSCGKNKVRRLISAGAGLIFKGSGFYITDYRSEGYKDSAKKAEGGESKPSEAAAAPGESKPSDSKPTESKPAATAAPTESKPAPKVEAPKTASKSAKKK